MKHTYHNISAFIAANVSGGMATVAYSVYELDRRLAVRVARIEDISEHRALLMAAWSAVSFVKKNLPLSDLSVYSAEKRTGNELSAAWMGLRRPTDFDDSDRIEVILFDCAEVKRVAFGFCPTEATGVMSEYARRMKEIVQLANTNDYGNNR